MLLPAAGHGVRLGRGPKALLELQGRSLLAWLGAGVAGSTAELLVAAPAGLEAEFRDRLPAHARVLAGGATRQETVHLLAKAANAPLVVVHDAARPFLPRTVFDRAVEAAAADGAATAAMPVSDTLIRREDGGQVNRDGLLAVQTPQAFRRDLLLAAHERALHDRSEATDDAALVRRLGHRVSVVAGSPWLLKLTHPGDFKLAERLAAAWPESGVFDAD